MGLMDDIVAEKNSSGNNAALSACFYVKDGEKKRVRFLMDGNDGLKVSVHIKWNDAEKKYVYKSICAKHFGKPCDLCQLHDDGEADGDYIAFHYAWYVWSWDDADIKIFCYKRSRATPLDQLTDQYGARQNIIDRDYIFTYRVNPKTKEGSWGIVSEDKEPFSMSQNGIKLPGSNTGKLDNDKCHVRMLKVLKDVFVNPQLVEAPAPAAEEKPKRTAATPPPAEKRQKVSVGASVEDDLDDDDLGLGDE